jgi:hypothetical protein
MKGNLERGPGRSMTGSKDETVKEQPSEYIPEVIFRVIGIVIRDFTPT